MDVNNNLAGNAAQSQSYWDRNPGELATGEITNASPTRQGFQAGDGDPVQINGGDQNSGNRQTGTTADGKTVITDVLQNERDISFERERTVTEPDHLGRQYITADRLVVNTGSGNDRIRVENGENGGLSLSVNGQSYALDLASGQDLALRTGDGDDVIDIAPDVRVRLVIDSGDGDNHITTGAGDAIVKSGDGNDTIHLGAGNNYVEAGAGDDHVSVTGGNGYNVIYGGAGNDVLAAGAGGAYIDGGAGNDRLYAGEGDNILIGGTGDDVINAQAHRTETVAPGNSLWGIARASGSEPGAVIEANPQFVNPALIHPGQRVHVPVEGGGDNRIYAGAGTDRVTGADAGDVVHAERADQVEGRDNTRVVEITIDPSRGQSIRIEGSDAFRERIQADLDFLASSPNGQKMLDALDAAATDKGNVVTIRELESEDNGFATESQRGDWNDTQIRNGRAGAGGNTDVVYNTSFSDPSIFPAPSVVFFHELSHAWNAVSGTFQPGQYNGPDRVDHGIANAERQAVGLESSAPPFDFDGDPSTPPSTTNPFELTENGLRQELNLARRASYAL